MSGSWGSCALISINNSQNIYTRHSGYHLFFSIILISIFKFFLQDPASTGRCRVLHLRSSQIHVTEVNELWNSGPNVLGSYWIWIDTLLCERAYPWTGFWILWRETDVSLHFHGRKPFFASSVVFPTDGYDFPWRDPRNIQTQDCD